MGSRGGGRWELLVFLLHLARFARALRGDWHRLGKRTDGFYFVDNRITPDSYNTVYMVIFVVVSFLQLSRVRPRENFHLSIL